ncbi:MAG: TlpA family protein disulfide reductase [Actinobacteria bacterium HGW-Actinobacteria-5]|jgi:thiol-disulfide isomerase/thioredoxin|nr:MAG: TlpA family protein disulfide reductase [Actinobacteria bacterium HGW-Actinobacteria-5]
MPSSGPVRAPRARLLGAVLALGLLLAGCGSAPTSTSGFVGGDGTLTVLPAGQRPAAPLIEGATLDGKAWTSADTKGKVVVYNVWGSWCAPCRAEASALVAASRRAGEAAVFVGLNTRDLDKAAPQAFVRSFGVPYVNLYDPDGALLLKFSGQLPASAIPSTLLVDPTGRVAARVVGETTEATLVGLIDDLAAGK